MDYPLLRAYTTYHSSSPMPLVDRSIHIRELATWDERLAVWRSTEPEATTPMPRRRRRSGPSSDPAISNG